MTTFLGNKLKNGEDVDEKIVDTLYLTLELLKPLGNDFSF